MMLGMLVTNRARRGDISWTFLAFYLGALATRVEYLGQRWAVWTHQLESGALLLFAFFMISDPMTGPNDRRGTDRARRAGRRHRVRVAVPAVTAPTDSSGLCLSRRRAFRCGTRFGPRANSNGPKMEVAMFSATNPDSRLADAGGADSRRAA